MPKWGSMLGQKGLKLATCIKEAYPSIKYKKRCKSFASTHNPLGMLSNDPKVMHILGTYQQVTPKLISKVIITVLFMFILILILIVLWIINKGWLRSQARTLLHLKNACIHLSMLIICWLSSLLLWESILFNSSSYLYFSISIW